MYEFPLLQRVDKYLAFALLAIAQAGHQYQCIAPDVLQHHVINHTNGAEMNESRNVFIESARIARGDIKKVSEVSADDFDGLVMPGGFGTLDEAFEALTLIQTKRIKPFPVILVGSDYWSGLLDWIKEKMLPTDKVDNDDLLIFNVMDDPAEIVSYIKKTVVF